MADDQKLEDRRKEVVDIWKTVVGVQMHFNDMSMRIRSIFATILIALFASIGFSLDKKWSLEFFGFEVQFSTLLPVCGMLGTYLFYFIDRYWYHRLLVGSVRHAIEIENRYKSLLPELCLSDAIGKESPYEPRRPTRWLAKLIVSDERFRKTGLLHSDGKIELFYKTVQLALVATTLMLAFSGGVRKSKVETGPNTISTSGAPPPKPVETPNLVPSPPAVTPPVRPEVPSPVAPATER